MMDLASDSIAKIVALLTAIRIEQEDIAYEIVLEMDPLDLFSTLSGILLGVISRLSEQSGITVDEYLEELGKLAVKMKKNEY
jgi:hypothetical protein